ncbi:ANTAR domain-containing protein [Nocardia sp. NPDC050697]|uniref:ANTAR domain-containing protein n=1 Tax=Nocardia sp. NPDC050697 TaxID=3155158 RepID=UPI0033E35402
MTSTQQRHSPNGIARAAANALGPVCVGEFGYDPSARTMRWTRRTEPRTTAAADTGAGRMSADVLLSQVHEQDREPLAEALASGQRFCLRVRLPDGAGAERTLILLVDQTAGEVGPGAEVEGIYLDLTDALGAQSQTLLDEKLPPMVALGATVEQAVGMLRLVYSITANKARELLLWRATETGVPVTEFAARLCAAVDGDGELAPAAVRARVDDLLLTLHERIGEATGPA